MKLAYLLFITILTLALHHQIGIVQPILAQDTKFTVNLTQDKGYGLEALTGGSKENLIGNIFKNVIVLFFTVGAIGFTIMIVWGAVDWILSGGDKEKIAGARKRITTAIAGLVILSLSFVIIAIAGQLLNIDALKIGGKDGGKFQIPGLSDSPSAPPP